jgi:hypothetical protein
MKKLIFLLIATLGLGMFANAQSRAFVQGTVATQNAVFSQGLEVGAITGKDRVSLVGQTFEQEDQARQYYAGIKYGRALFQGDVLSFYATGAALTHIDRKFELSIEPGAELNLHLGKNVALVGAMSAPLYQGETPFKSLNLKGAAGVQLRL